MKQDILVNIACYKPQFAGDSHLRKRVIQEIGESHLLYYDWLKRKISIYTFLDSAIKEVNTSKISMLLAIKRHKRTSILRYISLSGMKVLELILQDKEELAYFAAFSGDEKLTVSLVDKYNIDPNGIAMSAAQGGHLGIVRQMLVRHAFDYEIIVDSAAKGGHNHIIKFIKDNFGFEE